MKPFDGVIFDMDGTLTRPTLDFQAIRRELGIPSGDLVAEIQKLAPAGRQAAWAVVEAHEERAMEAQELQDGAAELLAACHGRGLRLGLVTRNARRSVDRLCHRFGLRFDAVVTREFHALKPDPAPVRHVIAQWGIEPYRALVVGDYRHDIESGRAAGTRTCFFHNPGASFYGDGADFVVASMQELHGVVFGTPGSAAG